MYWTSGKSGDALVWSGSRLERSLTTKRTFSSSWTRQVEENYRKHHQNQTPSGIIPWGEGRIWLKANYWIVGWLAKPKLVPSTDVVLVSSVFSVVLFYAIRVGGRHVREERLHGRECVSRVAIETLKHEGENRWITTHLLQFNISPNTGNLRCILARIKWSFMPLTDLKVLPQDKEHWKGRTNQQLYSSS